MLATLQNASSKVMCTPRRPESTTSSAVSGGYTDASLAIWRSNVAGGTERPCSQPSDTAW